MTRHPDRGATATDETWSPDDCTARSLARARLRAPPRSASRWAAPRRWGSLPVRCDLLASVPRPTVRATRVKLLRRRVRCGHTSDAEMAILDANGRGRCSVLSSDAARILNECAAARVWLYRIPNPSADDGRIGQGTAAHVDRQASRRRKPCARWSGLRAIPRGSAVFVGRRRSRNCDVGRVPRWGLRPWRGVGCMTGLYIIFGGMLLFVTIVVAYDLLARRQHRRRREQERRSA